MVHNITTTTTTTTTTAGAVASAAAVVVVVAYVDEYCICIAIITMEYETTNNVHQLN